MIDTYCWIHATFVLPSAFDKKIGVDVPHSGVDHTKPGEQRVYQKYYQWVCFVLFLQAILFYTPRYLWKLWEGRLLFRSFTVKDARKTFNLPKRA